MANYNKEGGRGRFGGNNDGGSRFSGNNGKKPFFGNKGRGDGRGGDHSVSMHEATCAECGNRCEVPFRPNGERPVYCKDCFGGNKGGNMGGDRFPRKDFSAPARRPFDAPKNNDAVMKQLEAVNAKLERLITAVGALTLNKPTVTKEEVQDTAPVAAKKVSKKKAAKK